MILTEAGVPILVIESILHLKEKQKLRQGTDVIESVVKGEASGITKRFLANEIFVKGSLFGVIEVLCQNFEFVTLVENFGNVMKLSVNRNEKTLGFVFQLLEALKDEHQLEDYSIS